MQFEPPAISRSRGSSLLRFLSGAICALGVPVLTAAAAAETALKPGEELTYNIRWAILPSAGELRITADEQGNGENARLHITTESETRGLAKRFLTFHTHSESVYDLPSGRLLSLHESSVTRSKNTDYRVSFNHDSREAAYKVEGSDEIRRLSLPDGEPADLITTLMKTRLWDLPVGASRDVLVTFRDEFYILTIHATRLERVSTSLGEFDTVVLEPRMEKTPPKGMFKRGGDVRIWVSRDEGRLPVRFQVGFKTGTGVATLTRYTPPTAATNGQGVADD